MIAWYTSWNVLQPNLGRCGADDSLPVGLLSLHCFWTHNQKQLLSTGPQDLADVQTYHDLHKQGVGSTRLFSVRLAISEQDNVTQAGTAYTRRTSKCMCQLRDRVLCKPEEPLCG